jgi:hypothetical protein
MALASLKFVIYDFHDAKSINRFFFYKRYGGQKVKGAEDTFLTAIKVSLFIYLLEDQLLNPITLKNLNKNIKSGF